MEYLDRLAAAYNLLESEGFCSRSKTMFRKSRGDNATAYSLPSEGTIQALQLLLYVMSFVTVILIFIYIAYERPEEKKKEKPEE